jgi:hypothetical protein
MGLAEKEAWVAFGESAQEVLYEYSALEALFPGRQVDQRPDLQHCHCY